MTMLGKILVLLNLAFSVAMAAWALGVYTQRIDYATAKATNTQPAGLVFQRQEQIRQLQALLRGADATDPKDKDSAIAELTAYRQLTGEKNARADEKVGGVENRWRLAYALLRSLELERTDNKAWYADQLKKLEVGPGKAKFFVYKKDMTGKEIRGEPELEGIKGSSGLDYHVPRLQDFKDPALDPREVARNELVQKQKSIDDELVKIGKLIKEDTELTEKKAGKDGKGGVAGQVVLQQGRLKKTEEEVKDLQPREINTLVESDLLLKRQEQLKGRVKELESRTTSSK